MAWFNWLAVLAVLPPAIVKELVIPEGGVPPGVGFSSVNVGRLISLAAAGPTLLVQSAVVPVPLPGATMPAGRYCSCRLVAYCARAVPAAAPMTRASATTKSRSVFRFVRLNMASSLDLEITACHRQDT